MVKVLRTKQRELLTNYEVYDMVTKHHEKERRNSRGRKKVHKEGNLIKVLLIFTK